MIKSRPEALSLLPTYINLHLSHQLTPPSKEDVHGNYIHSLFYSSFENSSTSNLTICGKWNFPKACRWIDLKITWGSHQIKVAKLWTFSESKITSTIQYCSVVFTLITTQVGCGVHGVEWCRYNDEKLSLNELWYQGLFFAPPLHHRRILFTPGMSAGICFTYQQFWIIRHISLVFLFNVLSSH